MASTSRRVLKVSDQNVKLTSNASNTISQKSMPAILSRKRKSEHLDMDFSDCYNFGSGPSGPGAAWPFFNPNVLYQVSNSVKQRQEEPMLLCTENLPPPQAKIRNTGKPLGYSNTSSSRVPLATLSSNLYNSPPVFSSLKNTTTNKAVANGQSPKLADSPSSKAPPPKKLRLSQSWSQFREFVQTSSALPLHPRGETPLPEIRWADRQEIWDLMCKKERGMYLRQSGDDILGRHPCFQPRMRAILFDWLVEVCEVYKLHRETFYLAVDFIDRFLGSTNNMPKTRVQLIGVTCLFIAAKIEEIYPPKLHDFAYVTDGACSEEEILSIEVSILKGLGWGLSPMTPNSWVKLYMQVNQSPSDADIVEKNMSDEDFILPRYSGKRFTRVMQLLDLCILDIGSLSFKYSVLAASAIYHCEDETTALQASGYKWDEISPCVNWMAPFVFALRESQMSPALIAPSKPMTNVSSDDVHNIQVHGVELSVLDRALERQAMILEEASRQSPDICQFSSHALPCLEMTPPDDASGVLDYHPMILQSNNSQTVIVPPTPSVFLSPGLEGDW